MVAKRKPYVAPAVVHEHEMFVDVPRRNCIPVLLGTKHDAGKLRWSLLPWGAVRSVVDVLTRGAIKYAPDNWRKVEDWRARYHDAMVRHVTAWHLGEKYDDEWGLPHLAHAACCCLFLLALDVDEP